MIPDLLTKGRASTGLSATSTPTNWTVEPLARSALAVLARRGVSSWHGPHQLAKKLRTTGRCLSGPSAFRSTGVPPIREATEKVGAALPTPTTGPEPELEPRPKKR